MAADVAESCPPPRGATLRRSDGAADDEWLVSSVGQGSRLQERAEMRHAVLSAERVMQPRRSRRAQTYVVHVGRHDDRNLFDHAGPTKSLEM